MYAITPLSKHNSSDEIVARIYVQTINIMKSFIFDEDDAKTDDMRNRIYKIMCVDVMSRMHGCREVSEDVNSEISRLKSKFSSEMSKCNDNSVVLPSVSGLRGKSEEFLYQTKNVLRDLSLLFDVFFDKKFDNGIYKEMQNFCNSKFEEQDSLTAYIKQNRDFWIDEVIYMRNAVEHPGGKSGSGFLNIANFMLTSKSQLEDPCWERSNIQKTPPFDELDASIKTVIGSDMQLIVNNLLEFSENLLMMLVKKKWIHIPFDFCEIPKEKRDPTCPIRFEIVFNPPLSD